MKLIVGLGNPGKEYDKTRHNVGFMFIDYFCNKNSLNFKIKMDALYTETDINNEKIIIIKPQTFMNNSGNSVAKYANFYKIPTKDIIIIYDDTSFIVGNLKIKASGSSAGHNGIDDVMNKLGTKDVKRIKIGIAKSKYNLIQFVLSKFNKEELTILNNMFEKNNELIKDFVILDFDHLMSKYNIKGE
jgi:PTH1 family peptidyl-tRNA hydrolase